MYRLNQGSAKTGSKRRFLVIAVVLVLIIGGILGALAYRRKHNTPATPASSGPTASPNQSPESVDADKKAADEQKQTLEDKNGNPVPAPTPTPSSGSNKKVVDVTITSGPSLPVRSYVSGIVEDGGTCTLNLTKAGATTVTQNQTGLANGQNVTCPPFSVSGLTSGEWTAAVTYTSNTSQGTSSGSKIVVP